MKPTRTTLILILFFTLILPACTAPTATPTPKPVTFDATGMSNYMGTSTIVDGITEGEITAARIEEAFNKTCQQAVPSIYDGNIRGKMCNFATVIRYVMDDGSVKCDHTSMAPDALDKALALNLKNVKSFGVAIFPIPEEDSVIADAVCK